METEIISGLKKGENDAVEAMVNTYGDRILRIAFAITCDRQLAEEVVQDTFIQVCKKINSFRSESSFQTWIYRIAVNMAKNSIRSVWFRRVSVLEYAKIDSIIGPSDGDPQEEVIEHEYRQEVILCLKKLPPKYREVLVLYYLEELDVKEIAQVINQAEGSIKSKLSRGRALLKKEMEKKRGIPSG